MSQHPTCGVMSTADHCLALVQRRYSFGQAIRSFANRMIALGRCRELPHGEFALFAVSVAVLLNAMLAAPQHLRSNYVRLLGNVVGD